MPTDSPLSPARKALIAAGIGNFVEWYDFGLYGYFATTIAALFFSAETPTAGLLSTFAVFGVGFIVRPLGGILFGHLGDRIGRRTTLAAAVLLMSVSSLAIGLLPTYDSIGLSAPILLFIFRLLQGFSAGGEYAGSNTFLIEFAPAGRRGRYASAIPVSVVLGTAFGVLIAIIVSATLSSSAMHSYGWRIPFLLAAPLGIAGLYLRLCIEESPVFIQLRQAATVERAPLAEAFRCSLRGMLVFFGYAMTNAVGFYLLAGYMVSYLTGTVKFSSGKASIAYLVALLAFAAFSFVGGHFVDRFKRKRIALLGCGGVLVITVPSFLLLGQGSLASAVLGEVLFVLFLSIVSLMSSVLVVEMFPAPVRYSAGSLSYNLCYTAFGGSAPYVATALVEDTGNRLAPGYYLLIVTAISILVIALALPENSLADPYAPLATNPRVSLPRQSKASQPEHCQQSRPRERNRLGGATSTSEVLEGCAYPRPPATRRGLALLRTRLHVLTRPNPGPDPTPDLATRGDTQDPSLPTTRNSPPRR